MLRTPFIRKLLGAAQKTAVLLAVLVLAMVVLEVLRAFRLVWWFSHAAGYAFLGVMFLVALWLAFKLAGVWTEHRALIPPPVPDPERATHDEYTGYCHFLIAHLKRLAQNPVLEPERQQAIRQSAYDIEEVLGAHPLADDLQRAIRKTRDEIIRPVHAQLRAQAEQFARERMRAVVEDVIEPPFPVINPYVVLYVQILLVSRIADLYTARLSLIEYFLIMRDVFAMLMRGRFFKLGQSLFAGVYANSPPLGRAVDDLGQSLTSIWLTCTVSRATIMRCEALGEWDVDAAAQEMDTQVVDLLGQTKDCLMQDAMPILRLRIRHSAPPGTHDAVGFSESVADGIAKAIDAVVKGYRSQPPGRAIAAARRTLHGDLPAGSHEDEPQDGTLRRRRRRRSSRRGVFQIFRTIGQRIKYSVHTSHLTK